MALDYAVILDSFGVSSGNVSYTNSDFGGGIPNVALLFGGKKITPSGGSRPDATIYFGACDDNGNEFAVTTNSNNGSANTDEVKVIVSDRCAFLLAEGDTNKANARLDASYNAMIANGIQLNHAKIPDDDYVFTSLILGGNGLKAYQVGTFTSSSTEDDDVTITTTGVYPNIIILCSAVTGDETGADDYSFSYGICERDLSQKCYGCFSNNGDAVQQIGARIESDRVIARVGNSGSVSRSYEVTAINNGSFEVTTREASNDALIGYIALELAGTPYVNHSYSTPTSTGNRADTGIGFEAAVVLELMTRIESIDSSQSGSQAGAFGFSCFDTNLEERSSHNTVEDGVSTTDTENGTFDNTRIDDDDGSIGIVSNIISMDSDGFTRDWTTVAGTSSLFLQIALPQEGGYIPERRVPRNVFRGVRRGVV